VGVAVGRDFQDLLQSIRDGSEEAAWELIEMYGPHIARAVRRRLPLSLRAKVASEDIVQSVWRSLFLNRDKLAVAENPDEFLHRLIAIANNRVAKECRKWLDTQARQVRREHSVQEMDERLRPVPSMDPSPSQFAIARERWQRIMAGRTPQQREIIHLRYLGNTQKEIAASLNINERTVRRVIDRTFDELQD
jgi:RNA polymerase sigma factor (sigma-70 family)